MAKRLRLRPLSRTEKVALRSKVRDLSLAARIHQRYRIIELARRGYGLVEVAERVGCHFTVAYDWVRRFNQSGFSQFERVSNPRGRPPSSVPSSSGSWWMWPCPAPASAAYRSRSGRSPKWLSIVGSGSCCRR